MAGEAGVQLGWLVNLKREPGELDGKEDEIRVQSWVFLLS
jgi:hypothetical protein